MKPEPEQTHVTDLRKILRENTLRLLAAEGTLKPNETGVSRLVKKGIGQGTAQRILEGKTSVGLDTLEQLSGMLGVSPWRLLQPQSPLNLAEQPPQSSSTTLSPKSLAVAHSFQLLQATEQAAVKTIIGSMLMAKDRS